MSYPPLTAFMPHRAPMLLLDRLVHHEDERVVTEATFEPGQLFVDEAGRVSPFVALELFAQSAAAHFGYGGYLRGGAFASGALLGTRKLEAFVDALPTGRALRVEAERVFTMPPAAQYDCVLFDGDRRLAAGTINVAMTG